MAKLTTKKRKSLPKGSFAVPGKRPGPGSYPIPDEAHARNALARVAQHGTPEEQRRVRVKVRKKFPKIAASGGKKASEPVVSARGRSQARILQAREVRVKKSK